MRADLSGWMCSCGVTLSMHYPRFDPLVPDPAPQGAHIAIFLNTTLGPLCLPAPEPGSWSPGACALQGRGGRSQP